MIVLMGSKNPAKIDGVRQAFATYFDNVEIVGVGVESGVPEQPVNLDIYNGASNRVNALKEYAMQNNIHADYYAAIESGITNSLGKWTILNVAVVEDSAGNTSHGTSAGFPVPEKYVATIISQSLGRVIDQIYNTEDIRKSGGGISILTHNIINRADLTRDAFIMALTQFIDEKWR